MTREEAIETLEKESCYECTWGCESPVKCTCTKCDLIDAVNVAIEALKYVDNPCSERQEFSCDGCDYKLRR